MFVVHLFSYYRYLYLFKQVRLCTHNIKLWRVPATVVTVQTRMRNFCIVELRITVNNITLLNVAQKCFYG
jgi:hypothetical protein